METLIVTLAYIIAGAGAVAFVRFYYWLCTSTYGSSYKEIDGENDNDVT